MRKIGFQNSMKIMVLISFLLTAGALQAGDITACELLQSQQVGDVQLMDVRSQAEYDKGHIFGAKLIPHGQLGLRYKELDKEQSIVVYCQSGRRAALAETLLRQKGFKYVHLLQGHWQDWDEKLTLLHCKSSITVFK